MKRISTVRISLLLTSVFLFAFSSNYSLESLVFKQNEKVVFLGNAFFENALANGEILAGVGIMFMHTRVHVHVMADDLEIQRKVSEY
jgi:hypothetical protein